MLVSIDNLLQGWDNESIARAMFYIKEEFNLQSMTLVDRSIIIMALIGVIMITTFACTLVMHSVYE
jgi:hypothetical protein